LTLVYPGGGDNTHWGQGTSGDKSGAGMA